MVDPEREQIKDYGVIESLAIGLLLLLGLVMLSAIAIWGGLLMFWKVITWLFLK